MTCVPAEFDQFVAAQVATGRYANIEEVVAAGLQLLMQREQKLEALRALLRPAVERLDRGEGISLDEHGLDAFFQQIMDEVDRKLDCEQRAAS